MKRNALLYAWTVVLTGLGTLLSALLLWQSQDAWELGACVALIAVASTFKVTLPGLKGTMTPGFVVVLVAVATLSWTETVVIGMVSGLLQTVWRSQSRPQPLQVAFNTAVVGLAGALAHGVAYRLTSAGAVAAPSMVLALTVAGITLLVANTLLVAAILCLLQERPLYLIFRSLQLWAFPYYLAGGLLSVVWGRVELGTSGALMVMATVSLYLLHTCYREVMERAPAAVGVRS
jgi:hypothetical protein